MPKKKNLINLKWGIYEKKQIYKEKEDNDVKLNQQKIKPELKSS